MVDNCSSAQRVNDSQDDDVLPPYSCRTRVSLLRDNLCIYLHTYLESVDTENGSDEFQDSIVNKTLSFIRASKYASVTLDDVFHVTRTLYINAEVRLSPRHGYPELTICHRADVIDTKEYIRSIIMRLVQSRIKRQFLAVSSITDVSYDRLFLYFYMVCEDLIVGLYGPNGKRLHKKFGYCDVREDVCQAIDKKRLETGFVLTDAEMMLLNDHVNADGMTELLRLAQRMCIPFKISIG